MATPKYRDQFSSSHASAETQCLPFLSLLLLLLCLEVRVAAVGKGAAKDDDGVQTETKASCFVGGRVGCRRRTDLWRRIASLEMKS
jgi:hypothetical protein